MFTGEIAAGEINGGRSKKRSPDRGIPSESVFLAASGALFSVILQRIRRQSESTTISLACTYKYGLRRRRAFRAVSTRSSFIDTHATPGA